LGENVVSKSFVWFLKFSMFNACVDLMQWYLIILNRVRKKMINERRKKIVILLIYHELSLMYFYDYFLVKWFNG
jgi:hypothetical protein